MHTFKVGDLARIVRAQLHPETIGEIAEVIEHAAWRHPANLQGKRIWCYRIRLGDGKHFLATPKELRPLDPPADDHRDVTTWSDCPWTPKELAR